MNKISTHLFQLDNCSLNEAIEKVKFLSSTIGCDYVVTPNIDHLERLVDDKQKEQLLPIYKNASLNVCDSKIFEKLLRAKGHKIKEVIPGSTLTEKLFSEYLTSDDSILIVGGDNAVIDRVRNKYTTLNIKHYNPPMGFINNPNEVETTLVEIENSRANYVFLAIGSPRQEIIAAKLKERSSINCVALCIGASILFLVGEEKRAPIWMQKFHIEWLYRMLQDPKRLVKRYYGNFLAISNIYKNL
ncbi:WecB/TagA/CpsF family glycosyltransferase [Pseudoalteromonas sp.]|uniref:WecB/TagA/CpsF family glycosyltransferase n=1 Tax=Pseudoalteromonas sp. TaxID=53249 RepID=UPI003562AF39